MFRPFLICALALPAAAAMFASGHYSPRVPQAGAVAQMDDYELGKSIFLGKTPLRPTARRNRDRQAERLTELQGKLPPSVRKSANLTDLAGQLDARQAAALEHFLAVRYKVK